MKPVGSKIPDDHYEKLRWLAYRKHTTVSAIIAAYVEMCLNLETDLIGFTPPASSEPGQ